MNRNVMVSPSGHPARRRAAGPARFRPRCPRGRARRPRSPDTPPAAAAARRRRTRSYSPGTPPPPSRGAPETPLADAHPADAARSTLLHRQTHDLVRARRRPQPAEPAGRLDRSQRHRPAAYHHGPQACSKSTRSPLESHEIAQSGSFRIASALRDPGWGACQRRQWLGCLPTRILPAGPGALALLPSGSSRGAGGRLRVRTAALRRGATAPLRPPVLRRAPSAGPRDRMGGLCEETLRRPRTGPRLPRPLHPPDRHSATSACAASTTTPCASATPTTAGLARRARRP